MCIMYLNAVKSLFYNTVCFIDLFDILKEDHIEVDILYEKSMNT